MRRLLILFFMLWLPLAALALMPDPLGARNGLRGRGHGLPDEEDLFNVRDRKRFLTDHWPEPSDILDSLVSHDASDIPMEDIRDQLKHDDITDRIQTQDVSHIPMRDVTEAYRARMLERGAPRRLSEGDDTATWWATWGGAEDDRVNAMIEQRDGTLALAGYTRSFGAGSYDALLLQLEPNGNLIRALALGRSSHDYINALVEQTDGTLALAGSTQSFGAGQSDALLLQLEPNGNLIRALALGGSSHDYIHALVEQGDGSLALVGVTNSFGAGNNDALLLQVAPSGDLVRALAWGGSRDEEIRALVEQTDGTLAMAGVTESFGAGSNDALLLQVAPSGELVRALVWGGSSDDYINALVEQRDGALALAGVTTSFGAGQSDALLLQVAPSGDLVRALVWGGSSYEYIRAMTDRSDGTLAMAGDTTSFGAGQNDALLLQVDPNGRLAQALVWGGSNSDIINALVEQTDGTLALADVTWSFGAGNQDGFILSLDREGQLSLPAGSSLQQLDITTNLTETNVSSIALVPWTTIQEQNVTSSIQSQNITSLITANASLPASAYHVQDRTLPVGDVATWWATWGGTWEDKINAMIQQRDGILALAGYTSSFGAGSNDVLLVRVGSNGNLLQALVWGGSSAEYINAMIQQRDGTLALAGYTSSFGRQNALLLQVAPAGSLVHALAWGGSGGDYLSALVEQSDDTLALAGYTSSFGAGQKDALLLQVGRTGGLVQALVWGGSSDEYIQALVEQSDGTLALAGYTSSFGAGNRDALLLQVDPNGNLIRVVAWGGSSDEYIHALVEQSDGTLALSGSAQNFGAGGADALLLQVGPNGNLIRAVVWGGLSYDSIYTLVEQADGALALAGFTQSFGAGNRDALLLQVNPEGSLLQALVWGGSSDEYINAVVEQSDGSLALAGYTRSFGAGSNDVFILSLDREGQLALSVDSPLQQSTITDSLVATNVSSTPLVPWTTIQVANITSSIQSQNITSLITEGTSPPLSAYQVRDRRLPEGETATWWATWGDAVGDLIDVMIQQSDGTLALAGSTQSFGAGGVDALLLQLDPDGQLLRASVWGGSSFDSIRAMAQQRDGGLALVGSTWSFGAGSWDALLLQVDPNGQLLRASVWGGSSSDTIFALVEQRDGKLALAGSTMSFGGGVNDALLMQLGPNGDLVQALVWGGAGNEYINALIERRDGSLAGAGSTRSVSAGTDNALLLQVESNGQLRGAFVWGGPNDDSIHALVEQGDGSLALAGHTVSFGEGDRDALFLQLAPNGQLQRAFAWGGSSDDYIYAMIEQRDGTFSLAGGTFSFGAGSRDGLLLQVDSNGGLVRASVWGGSNFDSISTVVEKQDGALTLAGSTMNFGADSGDVFILSVDRVGQLSLSADSPLQQSTVTDSLVATNVSSTPLVPWTTIQTQNITSSLQWQTITGDLSVTKPPFNVYRFNGSTGVPSPSPSPSPTLSASLFGSPSPSSSPLSTFSAEASPSAETSPVAISALEQAWQPRLVLSVPEYVTELALPLTELHTALVDSPTFEPPLSQVAGVRWQADNAALVLSGNHSLKAQPQRVLIRQESVQLSLKIRRRETVEMIGLPQTWLVNRGQELCFSRIDLLGQADLALRSNVTVVGPGTLKTVGVSGLALTYLDHHWLASGPLSLQAQWLNRLCYQSDTLGEARVWIQLGQAWEPTVSESITIHVQPTGGSSGTSNEVTLPTSVFKEIAANQTVEVLALMQDETPLLPWIRFNRTALSLKADPPADASGEYRAMMLIRNQTDELMRLPAVFFFDPPVIAKRVTLWDTITPESFFSAMLGGLLFLFVSGAVWYSSSKRRHVRNLMSSYTQRMAGYQDPAWIETQQLKALTLLSRLNEHADQIEVAANVMLLLPAALQGQADKRPAQAQLLHHLLSALGELYHQPRSGLTKAQLLPRLQLIEWQLGLLAWDLYESRWALTEHQRDQLRFLIKKVNGIWRKPCRGDKEAAFLFSSLKQQAMFLPYQGLKGWRLLLRQSINIISPFSLLKFIVQQLTSQANRWSVDGLWLRQLASLGRTDNKVLAILTQALDQAKGREAIQSALQALAIFAKRWPDRFNNLPLDHLRRWTAPKETAEEVKVWLMSYKEASELSVMRLRETLAPPTMIQATHPTGSPLDVPPDSSLPSVEQVKVSHMEQLSATLLVEEEESEIARLAAALTGEKRDTGLVIHENPLRSLSRKTHRQSLTVLTTGCASIDEEKKAEEQPVFAQQNPIWAAREARLNGSSIAMNHQDDRESAVSNNLMAFFNRSNSKGSKSSFLRSGERQRSQAVEASALEKEREAQRRKALKDQAAKAAWRAKPLISLFEKMNKRNKQPAAGEPAREPRSLNKG